MSRHSGLKNYKIPKGFPVKESTRPLESLIPRTLCYWGNQGHFPYFMERCAIPGESAFMPRIARDIAHHYPTLEKINTGSVPIFALKGLKK